MDPLSLDKLLSILDAIEESQTGNELALCSFRRIISEQTDARDLARRAGDVLRLLLSSGWIAPGGIDHGELHLTHQYREFIFAWDSGNLFKINRALTYPPYRRFLLCLSEESAIRIPARSDKAAKKALGTELKKKYDITFVAFDTFRMWAVAVGQAYFSPFEETVYWGGCWDDTQLSLMEFKDACWRGYTEVDKASGYANIGRLADIVCRRLKISFQAFEINLNALIKEEPDLLVVGPATIRQPSRLFRITTVRPRSAVEKERRAAQFLNDSKNGTIRPARPGWLEYRYLEDGVRIGERIVKLLRWEEPQHDACQ